MALSPDESTLVVTSAWSRTVSVIDLAKRQVQKTIEVGREPRGVVITPDGKKAYVTHLMGSAVTRIDLAGAASSAHPVALAADPARAPRRGEPTASLAFAPVLSEDGSRLMVPRHALGTVSATPTTDWRGFNLIWWGSATVDVMMLRDESALMPARASTALVGRFGGAVGMPEKPTSPEEGALPTTSHEVFVQPRDAILRRSTRTLLIASEGFDWVTEHDADALNPGLASAASYGLGDGYLTGKSKAPSAETGSAPQGIALSVDENEAYVWARGSREVFSVPLQPDPLNLSPSAKRERKYEKTVAGPFAEPFAKDAAAGRKLFYLARDQVMSGGLACSGCHPDGRDDGFVWHEARSKRKTTGADDASVFVATPAALFEPEDGGKARRTPMLAGRVGPAGPYGWHAQSKDLDARLIEGFGLHRWNPAPSAPTAYERANRLGQLAAFLRKGLRPPPRDASPLTAEEEKGRVLFENDKTQCKSCHPSDSDYTTRVAMPLRSPLPTRDGFATDDAHFRVPSLLFVGGLGPYYHDGSVKTLPELIEKNGNRMGDTSGLSADDRAALVAYLRRL
jgi:YVTN family beta-propeller protein